MSAPFGGPMGAKSVMPARGTAEPLGKLALVSYAESLAPHAPHAPHAPLVTNPHSLIRERREDRTAVVVLSATAGYIDAVGFISLVGLFPAHVTGELVGLTTAFTAGHQPTHASRFAVLPIFVGGLFVAAMVSRSRRRHGRSPSRALLWLIASALGVGTLTGFWSPTALGAEQSLVYVLREASIVSAMAFQNAFTRVGLAGPCPTTVMTGNLTHVVFELADGIAAKIRREVTEETHARPATSQLQLAASALGSFVVGAVLGGFITGWAGAFSIVLPMLAALALLRRLPR